VPITDPVIIAGAGPVGCTLALRLAQGGVPVRLLESLPAPPETLRASTFHPPTLDMLDRLGLAAPLIAQGLVCPRFQYRDRRTGEIAEFDLGLLAGETRHPYRLQAEQWKYTRLVWEALQRDHADTAACLPAHAVRGVHATADGVEVLAWVDEGGGRGHETVLRGSWLVGCDGADSVVRRAVAIPFEGFTYPERFVVVSTPFPLEEKFERLAPVNYIADPEEWLVLLRTPSLWRVLIPTDPGVEDDARWLADRWIQDRLRHMAPHDGEYPVAHRTVYRVHQRVAATWHRGRVLIAGDAAHINNPLGGMGMNGGIHDAWNLGAKLLRAHAGGDAPSLIAAYERERRGVTLRHVQEQTMGNKRALEARDADAQARRQQEWMATAADPERARAFLLRSSMIDGLREAGGLD
jgi:3-(3-hydroxy-phenyl)propionate hydroxylase